MKKKSKSDLIGYCYRVGAYQEKIPEITWSSRVRGLSSSRIVLEESMHRSTPVCIHPISLRDLPGYAKNHLALCLDKHFSTSELSPYLPLALEICKVDGKLLAIPEDISPCVFMTRVDLLQKYGLERPKTLSELQTQLEFLKKKTGEPSFSAATGGSVSRLGFICTVLGSFGVNLDGSLEDWSEHSEKMIDAYEWIRELYLKELIPNFDYFIRQLRPPSEPGDFTKLNSVYSFAWLGSNQHRWSRDFINHIDISLLPPASSHSETYHPLLGRGWIIPSNTRDPITAVKILKKTQDRELIKGNEMEKGCPFIAWQDLWEDPDLIKKHFYYHWAGVLQKIKHGYLVNRTVRKFELLDDSLRHALRDHLNGKDWLRALFTRESGASRKLTTHDVVKRALEYMDQNLSTIRSTSQVAAHVGMSANYFNQFFKKKMHIGCGAYLMRIRMERAQELLKTGKLSIKEISRELGFRYPQVFAEAFRKYWGKSPSEVIRA